jgi:hypothetical protein
MDENRLINRVGELEAQVQRLQSQKTELINIIDEAIVELEDWGAYTKANSLYMKLKTIKSMKEF